MLVGFLQLSSLPAHLYPSLLFGTFPNDVYRESRPYGLLWVFVFMPSNSLTVASLLRVPFCYSWSTPAVPENGEFLWTTLGHSFTRGAPCLKGCTATAGAGLHLLKGLHGNGSSALVSCRRGIEGEWECDRDEGGEAPYDYFK